MPSVVGEEVEVEGGEVEEGEMEVGGETTGLVEDEKGDEGEEAMEDEGEEAMEEEGEGEEAMEDAETSNVKEKTDLCSSLNRFDFYLPCYEDSDYRF